MADRAVKNGKLGVPQEVFDLDKDDRWQARLEEARARREIALREKAAGKAKPKKRLKPWEVEGAAGQKIEPVIQERENDRLDFADRVDSIRAAVKKNDPPDTDESRVRKSHNWARVVSEPVTDEVIAPLEPVVPPKPKAPPKPKIAVVPPLPEPERPPAYDEFDEILTRLPTPKADLRDDALVLPDAPAVSELASRYASTLEPEVEAEPEPEPVDVIEPEPEVAAPIKRKRPLILALTVMTLALLPLISKAPPLDKGPAMPPAPAFAHQPALGVTWSLQETPVPTKSGEWIPRVTWSPVPPIAPVDWTPAVYTLQLPSLKDPAFGGDHGPVVWTDIASVQLGQGTRLYMPFGVIADVVGAPSGQSAPIVGSVPRTNGPEDIPTFGNIPAKPRPPSLGNGQDRVTPDKAGLLKKAPLSQLKITILLPSSADQRVASEIAADLSSQGHERVDLREVDYSISSRNLRYFFQNDRAEAARLAGLYDAELRDFTWYRPKPADGTAELWLSGKSAFAGNTRNTAQALKRSAALEPPAPVQVLPMPTIEIERRQSFLRRLFDGLQHTPSGGVVIADDGDSVATTGSVATSDETGGGNGSGNNGSGNGNGGSGGSRGGGT